MSKMELVPKDFFSSLPFWDKLERSEQQAVQKETRELAEAHAAQVLSRTKMGEHLTNLQTVLQGRGLFVQYLTTLHFSYRTAYRYIEAYKAVKDQVPELALQMAAARGMDLVGYQADRPFGPYTEPIKQLPAPTEDKEIPQWLTDIEAKRLALPKKMMKPKALPTDTSLRMAFASVYRRFKSVQPGAKGKGRVDWVKRLISLLMAEAGLPEQTFKPEAVPESFRPKVGRPRKTA